MFGFVLRALTGGLTMLHCGDRIRESASDNLSSVHDRPVTLVTLNSAAQQRTRGSRSVTSDHLEVPAIPCGTKQVVRRLA
jgi:hypothetical protein